MLSEIKELKVNLSESQRTIDLKEREIKKTQEMVIVFLFDWSIEILIVCTGLSILLVEMPAPWQQCK